MVGDIAEVRIGIQYGQILALSNFHYVALTSDPTWEGRLVDVWEEFMVDQLTGCIAVDAEWAVLEWHEVLPNPSLGELTRPGWPNYAGTLGGTPAPGQVAAKVTWYVEGSHRSQRGRTFLGGIGSDQIENSRRISGDLTDALNAFATQLMSLWGPDGTEATARFGVLSRTLDGAPRSPVVVLPVIEYAVPSILGTQRLRLK